MLINIKISFFRIFPPIKMDPNQTLLNLCEVTGMEPDQAMHLLEASNWILEDAIALFYETGITPTLHNDHHVIPEDNIRAPIPQTHGRLIDNSPVTDNTFGFPQNMNVPSIQQFLGQPDLFARQPIIRQQKSEPQTKFDRIFAPPSDIMFLGTFEDARERARLEGKWILVNIQCQSEFEALKLNRDLWSDDIVKNVIGAYFIFWQVENNNTEGQRYVSFYNVTKFPTISIVDPKTGEPSKTWTGYVEKERFLEELQMFVEKNPITPIEPRNPFLEVQKSDDIIDDDEELKRAIAESLKQPTVVETKPIVVPTVEKVVVVAPKAPKYMTNFEQFFSTEKGTSTRIQIRFRNGKRDVLNLSLKTPLSALYSIIHSRLDDKEKNLDFSILFTNSKLENTDSKTIEQVGLANSSISYTFE
jgi:hypothetical protein